MASLFGLLLAASIALLPMASTQLLWDNSTIATCDQVNRCGSTDPLPNCTISANYELQSFKMIGINSFNVPFASSNWSWTVFYGTPGAIDKYYYLGMTPGYSKDSGPAGWAVFLTDIDVQLWGGNCTTALNGACASDLEKQAQDVVSMANPSEHIGSALEKSFNSTIPSSCSDANGSKFIQPHADARR